MDTQKSKKVIYVAGLYHSGSTLLDYTLSRYPQAIGLGEIYKYLQDGVEEYCSCGEPSNECEVWHHLLNGDDSTKSLNARYEGLVDHFFSRNLEAIIVDSSKAHPLPFHKNNTGLKGLPIYLNIKNVELYVVHLTRDARSWVSRIENRKVKKSNFFMIAKARRLLRYVQWFYGHKKIQKFCHDNGLNYIQISYEDLVCRNNETIDALTEFLSLGAMFDESASHITVGNPARHSFSSRRDPVYDDRWLKESVSITDYLGFKICEKLNKKFLK